MSVSTSLVKELRESTGISLLKCKNALEEANGDLAKAREILQKAGEKDAAKKAERSTKEGCVAVKIAGRKGAAVQVFCETDFVARGDDFVALAEKLAEIALEKGVGEARKEAENLIKMGIQKIGENIQLGKIKILENAEMASYLHSNRKIGVLVSLKKGSQEIGKEVAMQVAAMNPNFLHPADVPADLTEKEREIQKEILMKENKPAEILDKILIGKLRKFCDEQSLLKQAFVKDSSKNVEQFLAESDTEIEEFVRLHI
jgi:elongation factor Ts